MLQAECGSQWGGLLPPRCTPRHLAAPAERDPDHAHHGAAPGLPCRAGSMAIGLHGLCMAGLTQHLTSSVVHCTLTQFLSSNQAIARFWDSNLQERVQPSLMSSVLSCDRCLLSGVAFCLGGSEALAMLRHQECSSSAVSVCKKDLQVGRHARSLCLSILSICKQHAGAGSVLCLCQLS